MYLRLTNRPSDRMEFPLIGMHGEKLSLTGYTALWQKVAKLDVIYEKLPAYRGVHETILLDA